MDNKYKKDMYDGIGCFWVLLGLAIFFSFPAILALIGTLLSKR